MRIYYYCTYKNSPAGLHIGYIEYGNQGSGAYVLEDKEINPFIRKCLESGMVRSAFGAMPSREDGEKTYFLVKKKLRKKVDDVDYYMNIAIVCEAWEEFRHMMQEGTSEDKLASFIADSILIDTANEFGYRVDRAKAIPVAEAFYGNVCKCGAKMLVNIRLKNGIYFTLASAKADREALPESLGLPIGEYTPRSAGESFGETVYYGKKAQAHSSRMPVHVPRWMMWAIVAGLGIMAFLAMFAWLAD